MTRIESRWGESGPRPEPLAAHRELFASFRACASIDIGVGPERAWDLLTDVGRIGELSPECIGAEWLDGASRAAVGARFEGTNRIDLGGGDEYVWIRPCTVTACDPPSRFAYVVGDRFDGTAATEWETTIEPSEVGCRVTQTFRHLPDGLSGVRSFADADPDTAAQLVEDRRRSLETGIATTLARAKALLESA